MAQRLVGSHRSVLVGGVRLWAVLRLALNLSCNLVCEQLALALLESRELMYRVACADRAALVAFRPRAGRTCTAGVPFAPDVPAGLERVGPFAYPASGA